MDDAKLGKGPRYWKVVLKLKHRSMRNGSRWSVSVSTIWPKIARSRLTSLRDVVIGRVLMHILESYSTSHRYFKLSSRSMRPLDYHEY